MAEPCDLSAVEARRLIGERKLSPVELLESCIARIERTNTAVNSMVATDLDAARKRAKDIEQAIGRGEDAGLLAGLPVGVKDLQATAGLRTTFGSLLFKDNVPAEDEFNVANIRRAGGVIVGKTNTPEFGAGANTTNRVYGPTGNPFDPAKTCAGSSGGSAVALALGQVALATGSDLGGSLRTPASFCGVAGFRPSPGVVPNVERPASLTPFSVSGPMGRTVADAHLLLRAQMGQDKRDPFSSSDNARIPVTLAGADLGALRAAVSPDLGCAPIDHAIAEIFKARIGTFRHAFREVQERAPDFGPVHDIFEVHRCVQFVAAHRERLEKSRDLLDRNVIDNIGARTEARARRCQPGPRRADQALQALPGLLQGCGRADLSGGIGLAVPACAAVRRGDQRREDADLHALARHHLRADGGPGVCRGGAVRGRPFGHALRHPGHRPQRQRRPRAGSGARAGAGAGAEQGNRAASSRFEQTGRLALLPSGRRWPKAG